MKKKLLTNFKKQGKQKHANGGGKHKRVDFIYNTAVSAVRELAKTLQFSYQQYLISIQLKQGQSKNAFQQII